MCWAAIVDGRVLPLVWFETGESVNGQRYLNLLQQSLWPEVRHIATRREYWYQQDGAPCHCSNECLNFLHGKFPDRLISRRSEHAWPAHSPDLSPLDYWFWGAIESVIYIQKPNSIPALKRMVNEAARAISEDEVRRAVANFNRRVRFCASHNGGYFEAEI